MPSPARETYRGGAGFYQVKRAAFPSALKLPGHLRLPNFCIDMRLLEEQSRSLDYVNSPTVATFHARESCFASVPLITRKRPRKGVYYAKEIISCRNRSFARVHQRLARPDDSDPRSPASEWRLSAV